MLYVRKAERVIMRKLTVIIHNWQRTNNVIELIKSIRKQTIDVNIWVWNNNPVCFPGAADWVIDSSRNDHLYSFVWMASQCETKYVMRIDDDLKLHREDTLERLVGVMNNEPVNRIVGAFGVNMLLGHSYSESKHTNTPVEDLLVDIVKGRVMCFHSTVFDHLEVQRHNTHHIDITLSRELANGMKNYHLLTSIFHDNIIALPEGDVGYDRMSDHVKERNLLAGIL